MGEVKLHHPGIIFACTDGLTDVTNDDGVYFDDTHINRILQNADPKVTAEKINDSLMTEVDIFRGTKPYPDDIAMLTCRYSV